MIVLLIVGFINVVIFCLDMLGIVYMGLGFNVGLYVIGYGGSLVEGVDL